MAGNNIVVVGSSNTDMIIRLAHLPSRGETVLGGDFAIAAGGKGANQAVGAARAGGRVTLIARIGRDLLGDKAVAGFVRDGINVDHVARDAAVPSGIALILTENSGENIIAVAAGSNGRLSPADVGKGRGAIARAGALVAQLETPLAAVQAAASIAVRAGVRVILNPAPARPLPNRLLRQVSILTPNETEAELLTGIKVNSPANAAKAADRLMSRGVGAVIITLGRRGCLVATREGKRLVPGFKVKPVDTTAAGDIFNGALAVALGEGMPLLDAARFANAAAAISVTRPGAQPSAPTRAEIERFLKQRRC
jgi:ribokinase